LPFALGCCLKRSLRGNLLDPNTAEFMSAWFFYVDGFGPWPFSWLKWSWTSHSVTKQWNNSVYPVVSVGVGRQNPTAPPTSSGVRGLPFAALGCCLKRTLRGDLLDLNTAEFMSAMNVFCWWFWTVAFFLTQVELKVTQCHETMKQ
jgi:hypothetical protein